MKITELIAQLEAVKAEHGDLDCVINYSDYGKRSVKGIIYREGRPYPLEGPDTALCRNPILIGQPTRPVRVIFTVC